MVPSLLNKCIGIKSRNKGGIRSIDLGGQAKFPFRIEIFKLFLIMVK